MSRYPIVCQFYNSFLCAKENICVSINVICDGNSDCKDGSDERNCIESMNFICGLSQKINSNLICNYFTNCNENNDDEKYCGN